MLKPVTAHAATGWHETFSAAPPAQNAPIGQRSAEPPLQKKPGGAAHGVGVGDGEVVGEVVWPAQSASSRAKP